MLQIGLNPFGMTYTVGIQGHGTSRVNPDASGLEGFIETTVGIGAETIELPSAWLSALSDNELISLRARLDGHGLKPIIGSSLANEPQGAAIRPAAALGASTIRLALTSVLCGDRGKLGDQWKKLADETREALRGYAELARQANIWLAIENHQDFGSQELLDLCDDTGPNVGICYDTGNSFPVAESPLAMTQKIAARVRHVHLKDYQVQFTDLGFRLVRCATGDGAVPIKEIVAILNNHHDTLTASIEIAALDARYVKLLTPQWWENYPPVAASELAECLAAAHHRRLTEDADCRTLWERGQEGPELVEFELNQVRKSAENLKAFGIMKRNAK